MVFDLDVDAIRTSAAALTKYLHGGVVGLPLMSPARRHATMTSLYGILSPPAAKGHKLAECGEPELVLERAILETLLADSFTSKLLQATGLRVATALVRLRDQDREVAIGVTDAIVKEARVTKMLPMAVDQASKVATALGLSLGRPGSIQRLRDAIRCAG